MVALPFPLEDACSSRSFLASSASNSRLALSFFSACSRSCSSFCAASSANLASSRSFLICSSASLSFSTFCFWLNSLVALTLASSSITLSLSRVALCCFSYAWCFSFDLVTSLSSCSSLSVIGLDPASTC